MKVQECHLAFRLVRNHARAPTAKQAYYDDHKNHQVSYDYHGDGNNERVKQELSCQPATERQACGKQTEFHV